MALFDTGSPQTLADVLAGQANTASTGIENAYAQRRKRLVGQQAVSGRLRSGVSNYNFGDLNASELGDLGGVQGNLASALGQIPLQDYADTQDYNRQVQLANLIADLTKPSGLQQAFGMAGSALNLVSKGAGLYGGSK